MPPELRSIATLPLRLTLRVAGTALAPLGGVAGRAVELVEGLFERNGHAPAEASEPAAPAPVTADPATPATPDADAAAAVERPTPVEAPDIGVVEAAGSGPVPATEVDEPVHVSEEPVLVAESADVGAAEGVTTDLRVEEPWKGYAASTAQEVIAALEDASPAQIAVVQLYESTHRARKTVIEAAERQLARR